MFQHLTASTLPGFTFLAAVINDFHKVQPRARAQAFSSSISKNFPAFAFEYCPVESQITAGSPTVNCPKSMKPSSIAKSAGISCDKKETRFGNQYCSISTCNAYFVAAGMRINIFSPK